MNMSDNKNVNQDKGLQGNEKIEQAIAALQQEATQEMLAHTLTVIRIYLLIGFIKFIPAKLD